MFTFYACTVLTCVGAYVLFVSINFHDLSLQYKRNKYWLWILTNMFIVLFYMYKIMNKIAIYIGNEISAM